VIPMVRIAGRLNGMFLAWCPALPGCVVYSLSRGEAETRIQQAVSGYLKNLDAALPRELALRLSASRTRSAPIGLKKYPRMAAEAGCAGFHCTADRKE
jgi:predicted RNase H-like HicB family nuclease